MKPGYNKFPAALPPFAPLLLALILFVTASASAQIAKVHLVSPSNGATDVSPCVTLEWDAASGATGYYYEVMTNSQVAFSGGSDGATQVALTLDDGTTYQWHVQGRTSQNTGPFSDTWTFTTKTPIPAPTLVAPANGASVASLNVTLEWNALGDATFYNFEVDDASGVYTNVTITASNTNLLLTLPEGSYTWRIQGLTSCREGPWSGYWAFSIPPIPAPVQDFPADGSANIGLQPTLQWEAAAGATVYDYQLYLGVGGTLIDTNTSAITGLSATVNPVLAQNTVYSWRVRGRTSARDGAWSPLATFTTVPPLSAPVLLTPTNNATGTGLNVSLNWQTVSGATGYNYEILENGSLILSSNGLPPQAVTIPTNGVCQWQVQGITTLRTGAWSAPFTFDTQPPIPTPTLVAPLNGSENDSFNVTLVWDSVGPLATFYDFEVDDSEGNIATNGTVTAENTNINITLADGSYTWEIRGATSQRQGAWSSPFIFTIPLIPAPVQDFPTNNAKGIEPQPTLQWEAAPGATGYDYQLFLGVGDFLIDSNSTSITGLSAQVNPILDSNTLYSWRVRGHTSARDGEWSPLASFTTFPPPIPESPKIIVQPAILTPPSFSSNVTVQVVADGSPALSYQWYFNGSSLTDSAHISGSTSNLLTVFDVQASDEGNYSVVVVNPYGQASSSVVALEVQAGGLIPDLGGGVIIFNGGPGGDVAYLQINVLPPEAAQAGGGWRIPALWMDYFTNFDAGILDTTNLTVQFNPIPGWFSPTNNSFEVTPGQQTTVNVYYTHQPIMTVGPAQGLAESGYAGGPVTAANVTYSITNTGTANLGWSASTAGWLSLTATNGTLAAGQTTNVVLTANSSAYNYPAAIYLGWLSFDNLTNSVGNVSFLLSLDLQTHPDVVLQDASIVSNNNLQMTLQGLQGTAYTILCSSNLQTPLSNWVPVLTITNLAGTSTFAIPTSLSPSQFYRVKELHSN